MGGRPGPWTRPTRRAASLDSLSQREREVLAGVMRGCTNKQIGGELGISHRTVEIHRARLMRKLHVTTLADLLAVARPAPLESG